MDGIKWHKMYMFLLSFRPHFSTRHLMEGTTMMHLVHASSHDTGTSGIERTFVVTCLDVLLLLAMSAFMPPDSINHMDLIPLMEE